MSVAVLPTLLAGAGTAAWATFTAARVLLWASLVTLSWFQIIEADADLQDSRKDKRQMKDCKDGACAAPGTAQNSAWKQIGDGGEDDRGVQSQNKSGLTKEALDRRDQAQATGTRRWPAHIEPMDGASSMGSDESIDQWSIWGDEDGGAAASPPATAHITAHAGPEQQAAVAKADQHEEAHMLETAQQNVAIKEPAKHIWKRGPGGHVKKEKRPFVSRKIEKWFITPFATKYEKLGYFCYKVRQHK